MKTLRFVLGVALALLAVGCGQKYEQPELGNELKPVESPDTFITTKSIDEPVWDYTITEDMIRNFYKRVESSSPIASVIAYPSEELTAFYIVNFKKGWAIIPADSRFGPTLAESPEGFLDLNREKGKYDGFNLWRDLVAESILKVRGQILEEFNQNSVLFWERNRYPIVSADAVRADAAKHMSPTQIRNERIWVRVPVYENNYSVVSPNISHLIQTKWGIAHPWNVNMPSVNDSLCQTGSAAVAVSQVLYYYHTKDSIPMDLFHSVGFTNGTIYNLDPLCTCVRNYIDGFYYTLTPQRSDYVSSSSRWNDMPLIRSGQTVASDGERYVSDLLLDVGMRLGMHYRSVNSYVLRDGNGYVDLSSCLTYQQSPYTSNEESVVLNNLSIGDPVIVSAYDGDGAYVWIIDGYQRTTWYTKYAYLWYILDEVGNEYSIYPQFTESDMARMFNNYYSGMYTEQESSVSSSAYRMNWGLDGSSDQATYSIVPTPTWLGLQYYLRLYYNIEPQTMYL